MLYIIVKTAQQNDLISYYHSFFVVVSVCGLRFSFHWMMIILVYFFNSLLLLGIGIYKGYDISITMRFVCFAFATQ